MKKLFAVLVVLLAASVLFAQNWQKPEDATLAWKTLQSAQIAYEQGKFGEAIKLADTAKQQRKNEVGWAIYTLDQALKPTSVQKVGDIISDVIKILSERNSEDALAIMHGISIKYPFDTLSNSITKLKDTLALYTEYPEADYMLGKLYTLEGEYITAENYLANAWEHANLLDVPDQQFDILYQRAYLAKLQKDYENFEKSLLLIIASDGYVTQDGTEGMFIKAVKQSLKKSDTSIDKLFMLYRSSSYTSLNAYYQLADYYTEQAKELAASKITASSDILVISGENSEKGIISAADVEKNTEIDRKIQNLNDKALTMSTLASLSSFTRMYEAVKERDMEYSYSTFLSYLKKTGEYYEIAEWGARNGIWKGYYTYAQILYNNGRSKLAEEMLANLSQYCPEDFWRNMALSQRLGSS